MLYGCMQQAVRFDKDVGRGACRGDTRGMPGGAGPGFKDQRTRWSKRGWARPPDITSSAWEGEKRAACTEATSCAM